MNLQFIQRRVFVAGRVQGVGFRLSAAREVARYPRIKGFVRNLPDGRVEALFAGIENEVLALVAWCRKGPPQAVVKELEVLEESYDPTLPTFCMKH